MSHATEMLRLDDEARAKGLPTMTRDERIRWEHQVMDEKRKARSSTRNTPGTYCRYCLTWHNNPNECPRGPTVPDAAKLQGAAERLRVAVSAYITTGRFLEYQEMQDALAEFDAVLAGRDERGPSGECPEVRD